MKNFKLTLFLSVFFIQVQFSQTESIDEDFEASSTINPWVKDGAEIDDKFENPFKIGINTSNFVLKYDDSASNSYANVRFDTKSNFDLSTNNTFSIKIYVPSSSITGNLNNQVSLKLQDGKLGQPWTTQSEIIKNINLDVWQTITFDFENDAYINLDGNSAPPKDRTDFSRVLIQVNGEDNKQKVIAYIDDFTYDGTIKVDLPSNFDTLVWSDEFNGNGEINKNNWFQQTLPIISNNTSWANGEIQHYTNRTDNSYVSNGTLKILAKREKYTNNSDATTYNVQAVEKDFTSARLNSKFAFTYGKVEIRAKMPFGVGTFPALWMLGQNITETGGYWAASKGTTSWPDCGEIDIIEHWGDNQNYVASALHNRSSFGGTVNKGGRVIDNASTEFHIYTLEWDKDKMIFKVDGIEHYRYNPENKNIQNWPYDAPQYLLFNVAILPVVTSSFTQSAMEVDYVRVYQESSTLSNEDNLKKNEILIYPNPIENKLNLKIPQELIGAKATIYSLLGQRLGVFTLENVNMSKDISDYKKGIYFIKVDSNLGTKKYKIVKK